MTFSLAPHIRRRDVRPALRPTKTPLAATAPASANASAPAPPAAAPPAPALASAHAPAQTKAATLAQFVAEPDYPCLGARSVFSRDRATVRHLGELGSASAARRLRQELVRFAETTDVTAGFASFVAVFTGPAIRDEAQFEQLLWQQLQLTHDADHTRWAPGVSADPASPHFAFSVGGTAYFVVGLHPRASRRARRATSPTLVFNLHQQFESLRATGKYPRMRDTIRRRDVRFQGDVNPSVADHGSVSEARQYAGREVGADWHAPFVP